MGISHFSLSLLGQRVAWYLFAQWQLPTTFREMSRDPLPWRGRSKPSRQQWNVSQNRIMIWKSSCVKGTQDITLKRRTKKAPALREDTKRGQKVAIPLVGQNDRT